MEVVTTLPLCDVEGQPRPIISNKSFTGLLRDAALAAAALLAAYDLPVILYEHPPPSPCTAPVHTPWMRSGPMSV